WRRFEGQRREQQCEPRGEDRGAAGAPASEDPRGPPPRYHGGASRLRPVAVPGDAELRYRAPATVLARVPEQPRLRGCHQPRGALSARPPHGPYPSAPEDPEHSPPVPSDRRTC